MIPMEKNHRSLRVCCYGSSSSNTPSQYLTQAYNLGLTLAKRNHTCVNGAGAAGCMSAMNRGASDGEGRIVGVVHDMFLVDGSDWTTLKINDACRPDEFVSGNGRKTMLIAGGDDLQERKKLLVRGADAVVVLPGGPGTWDELWEMACAKNIGLTSLPIVCVNVEGYYDPFRDMLQKAYEQKMVLNRPDDIVLFVDNAEDAVLCVEQQCELVQGNESKRKVKERDAGLSKQESVIGPPIGLRSFEKEELEIDVPQTKSQKVHNSRSYIDYVSMMSVFMTGVAAGFVLATRLSFQK